MLTAAQKTKIRTKLADMMIACPGKGRPITRAVANSFIDKVIAGELTDAQMAKCIGPKAVPLFKQLCSAL